MHLPLLDEEGRAAPKNSCSLWPTWDLPVPFTWTLLHPAKVPLMAQLRKSPSLAKAFSLELSYTAQHNHHKVVKGTGDWTTLHLLNKSIHTLENGESFLQAPRISTKNWQFSSGICNSSHAWFYINIGWFESQGYTDKGRDRDNERSRDCNLLLPQMLALIWKCNNWKSRSLELLPGLPCWCR